MKELDIVIVGAGPAGAAAAYDLATRQFSVLLLDKTDFPRKKPCAGGLTVKAENVLPYSVTPVIRRVCRNIEISNHFKKRVLLKSTRPLVFMADRSQLDTFCLNQAIRAGAVFRAEKKIRAVVEHDGFVETVTENETFRSEFLLGADGANSFIRKWCDPFPQFRKGFAIEAKVPMGPLIEQYELTFDFGVVASGYGWVFPKDDHIHVGVYTYDEPDRLKATHLRRYCRQKMGSVPLLNLAAHNIGLGGWAYRPRSKRIFLVGDAAGLADPLLGEGLHNAIQSGRAAAAAIIGHRERGGNPAARYHQNIAPIRADIRLGYQTARWFYRFPALGYALLTHRAVREKLIKGYAEGLTLERMVKRLIRCSS